MSRSHRCRGFSLVEAVTAMVILAGLVVAMLGAVPAAYADTQRCMVRVQAVAAGQQYLDAIRQYIKTTGIDTGLPAAPTVAVDQGQGFISRSTSASPATFSMTPQCSARSLFSFDCTVTVSWNEGVTAQSVRVESYIASQTGF